MKADVILMHSCSGRMNPFVHSVQFFNVLRIQCSTRGFSWRFHFVFHLFIDYIDFSGIILHLQIFLLLLSQTKATLLGIEFLVYRSRILFASYLSKYTFFFQFVSFGSTTTGFSYSVLIELLWYAMRLRAFLIRCCLLKTIMVIKLGERNY